MNLREAFMEEFGKLSKKIQNNALQGKIQMFFRLEQCEEISKTDLAKALDVTEGNLVNAMENFILYGVVEEKDDTYMYKGYPPEFKDLVAMLPDRKKKLQDSTDRLTALVNEAEAQGQEVKEFLRVIYDIKRDFGLK